MGRGANIQVGIPVYKNHVGLLKLLDSLRGQGASVIVVDNGGEYRDAESIDGVDLLLHPRRNLGVAGGWNAVCAAMTDQILISNDDVVFGPSAISTFSAAPTDAGLVFGPIGYSCFLLRRWAYDLLGPFDEGFYPAYYEDSDYTQRYVLADLPVAQIEVDIKHVTAGRGHLKWVQEGAKRNKSRFIAKWGFDPSMGHSAEKGYKTPFNRGAKQPSKRYNR